jgi:hypothetical protein
VRSGSERSLGGVSGRCVGSIVIPFGLVMIRVPGKTLLLRAVRIEATISNETFWKPGRVRK